MIFITGDTHGDFSRIRNFCNAHNTTTDDTLIILGDAGINYNGYEKDLEKKKYVRQLPITLFCIHGNHEQRPSTIQQYKIETFKEGSVYCEDLFPNIKFAIDGEIYLFYNYKTLVCGGAYSVDKFYRLKNFYSWFKDEQPDDKIKNKVMKQVKNNQIDIFLSHTCPYEYRPVDTFLKQVDQSTVDTTTEEFLQEVYDIIDCKKWYCGHYHINRELVGARIEFLFDNVKELNI